MPSRSRADLGGCRLAPIGSLPVDRARVAPEPVHLGVPIVAGDPADGHRRLVLPRHDHEVAKFRIHRELPEFGRVFRDSPRIGILVRRCDLLPHIILAPTRREVSDLLKAEERQVPVQPGVLVFPIPSGAEEPNVHLPVFGPRVGRLTLSLLALRFWLGALTFRLRLPGSQLGQLSREQEAPGVSRHRLRLTEHLVQSVPDPRAV